MTTGQKRVDTASRVIQASPETLYQAFLNPSDVMAWKAPADMTCEILVFEPRQGGTFKMSFGYKVTDHTVRGKTSEHADVFEGKFVELVPNRKIVERVVFESDDPAYAGAMTITTTFTPAPGGTEVSFRCEDVPEGIRPEDHQQGMASSLNNLAAHTEK